MDSAVVSSNTKLDHILEYLSFSSVFSALLVQGEIKKNNKTNNSIKYSEVNTFATAEFM